jgi:dolichol-phosphate mannosyltransferase
MNNSDIAVIIPAYNEQGNLRILLKDIEQYLPSALIVIVDDSSSGESRVFLTYFHRNYPKAILISRGKKLGRGSAVIRGLEEALKNKKIHYCFEMDADLAHLPSEFDRFLTIRNTADMVVGSRYLHESKIVKWPVRRLIQSRIINILLNIWLGLHLTDYTNGFRLYSRKAAEYLVAAHLREEGFIALSEIAFKLKKNGFRIAEVPISFQDRKFGRSNANLREILRSLVGAIRIRVVQ